MDNEKIGKFIALRRKELGLTQKQLAVKLHVTDKAISKWETGMGCPDVSLLGELSENLEVGIGEILNGEYDTNLKDNNKFILDAVNYSKETTTKKIYKKISFGLTFIMSICCLYMLVVGIYQTIYFNKTTTYTVDSTLLKKIEEERSKVIEKHNFLSGAKSDILNEKDKESIDYFLKIYDQDFIKQISDRFLKEQFTLNQTEQKILYYDSSNILWTSNYMGTMIDKYDKGANDISTLIRNVNNILYKKDSEYFSDQFVYIDTKVYDFTEYKYSNINNQPNFYDIHDYILIHFQEMNILLEQFIEVGEFYE